MKYIGKAVNTLFGSLFAAVIVFCIIEYSRYLFRRSPVMVVTIIPILLLALVLCSAVIRLEKVFRKKAAEDDSFYNKAFVILPLALLAVQLAFAAAVDFTPINDLSHLTKAAENFVRHGIDGMYEGLPERHQNYLVVYPNNHLLFMIIVFCYRITYAVTGEIFNLLPTVLNIAALNISYILVCKCAKMLYKPEKALVITYAPMFYTDSLCMPFITAAAYLYIKFCRKAYGERQKKLSVRGLLLPICCGALLAVGYGIKGSAVIMLIAISLDVLIRKKGIAGKAAVIISMGLSFALVGTILSSISSSMLGITDEQRYSKEFPKIHWIMMSADGRGGYNEEDFYYTKSFDGYDNKVAADKERLVQKIKDQGVGGFAYHLYRKISYTWKDGTYMTCYYNKDNKLLNNWFFRYFVQVLHFALLFMLLRGYLSRIRVRGDEMTNAFFLKICHMGLFAFLLIWEARNRYLVSYFLLFALI